MSLPSNRGEERGGAGGLNALDNEQVARNDAEDDRVGAVVTRGIARLVQLEESGESVWNGLKEGGGRRTLLPIMLLV